jgi:hypothetical protein
MSSQSIERKINDLTRRMHEAAQAEDFELAPGSATRSRN